MCNNDVMISNHNVYYVYMSSYLWARSPVQRTPFLLISISQGEVVTCQELSNGFTTRLYLFEVLLILNQARLKWCILFSLCFANIVMREHDFMAMLHYALHDITISCMSDHRSHYMIMCVII